MSRIAMVITSTAAPGKREELYELYLDHLAPRAEANPDQELVVWCASTDDPDEFVLFELYRTEEALAANAGSEWFAAYMEAAMPLLTGQPRVTMAEPRWTTGR